MAEPTKAEILRAQYDDWMRLPMTRELFIHIEDHRKSFIDRMAVICVDEDVTDSQIRMYAFGLRTLDTLTRIIKDPNQLIKE